MEILAALGVDATIGIQFVIFVFAYFFLNNLLFKPYHRAYEERIYQTTGNTELAEKIISETKDLELQFETKARSLNNETKIIFDRSRAEAIKEYDRIVSLSRERAQSIMEKARMQITYEMNKSQVEISKEIPGITQSVIKKLIDQEARA